MFNGTFQVVDAGVRHIVTQYSALINYHNCYNGLTEICKKYASHLKIETINYIHAIFFQKKNSLDSLGLAFINMTTMLPGRDLTKI